MIDALVQNINQLNVKIHQSTQLNQKNINELRDDFNETMKTHIDNYIAFNDLTLKEQGNKYKKIFLNAISILNS